MSKEKTGEELFDPRQAADASFDTLAIRTGRLSTDQGSHGEPIFTTSSFVFENAAQAAARFAGDEDGFIYSRFSNPTVSAFEERLAALEGAERCVATASVMSAIMATMVALLANGDELVSSRSVFGTTNVLLTSICVAWVLKPPLSISPITTHGKRQLQIKPRFCF